MELHVGAGGGATAEETAPSYLAGGGTVRVLLKRGHNLAPVDWTGTSDPYVVAKLGTSHRKSKRTDRLYDTNGTLRSFSDSDQLRCFGSSQFMCHAYGLTANFTGFNPAGLGPHWKQILAQAYEARWRTLLPRLRELQGLRGTTPVSLEAITKVSRARAL